MEIKPKTITSPFDANADDIFQNHMHKCELVMLYGKWMKKHKLCPMGFKDAEHDECDDCKHLRIVNLSGDSMTITGIE